MRYLDNGLFRGVAEEVFGCYAREWESALRKGECAKLVTAGSVKELRGFRMCRFNKQKQRPTSYSMRKQLWGNQKGIYRIDYTV